MNDINRALKCDIQKTNQKCKKLRARYPLQWEMKWLQKARKRIYNKNIFLDFERSHFFL